MIFVPYLIGVRSRDGARLAGGDLVAPELPAAGAEGRLAVLYEALAARVETCAWPRVQAGDCVATLGVAAGLQRRGVDFHLVWLDAHHLASQGQGAAVPEGDVAQHAGDGPVLPAGAVALIRSTPSAPLPGATGWPAPSRRRAP